MSFNRAVGNVLRAAVGNAPGVDDILGRTRRGQLRGLARAAAFHGIVGYVDRAVAASSARERVPIGERTQMREATTALVDRHAAIVDNLRQIGVLFDTVQVPWLVVKGPVLAVSAHGAPELRVYEDLDVVVPTDSFGDVLEALEQAGAAVLAGDWQARLRARAGEVPVRLPSGLLVDLHWHLINSGATRDHFRVQMADLFERRTHVDVGGVAVPALDPADALAHVALHTVLSGSHRLVWFKDLERLVARHGQEVLDTATVRLAGWGGAIAMADAMQRTERTVGLPPGIQVSRAVNRAPRAWSTVAAVAERLSPVERQDGTPSILRMVSRAVRQDAPSSARVLAGKAWGRATATVSRTSGEHVLPAAETEASAARVEYLAEVMRGSTLDEDGMRPRNDL